MPYCRESSSGAAADGDQSGREPVELLEQQRAFAFRRAQLHRRDQAAEVLVPGLAGHEHRQLPIVNRDS